MSASYPADRLETAFAKINRRYFDGAIKATVAWDVPPVSVPAPGPGARALAGGPRGALAMPSERLIAEVASAYDAACATLGPRAQAGDREAAALLVAAARRAGRTEDVARWNGVLLMIARNLTTTAPASCYIAEPGDNSPNGRILIHPFIRGKAAPTFVLNYLLFHESTHQLVPTEGSQQHSDAFLVYERQAPDRKRAMAWLVAHGFPVLLLPEESTVDHAIEPALPSEVDE